jgi:hypothetical protein
VYGEVDDLFEQRVRLAMRLMEEGRARSRVEALAASRSEHLEAVRPWSPDHELDPLVGGPDGLLREANTLRPVEAGRILPLGVSLTGKQPGQKEEEEPGGKTAPTPPSGGERNVSSPDDRADGALPPDTPGFSSSVESLKARTKWREAYRTVFGEEPDGQLAEARIRAAMNFYDPERSVGRRQALEAVRASEEEAASRTREAGRVFGEEPDDPQTDEEPEGEWLPLPSEDALTLGAALMKIGRLEAEVGELRRAVARLEERLHRTETRLGGLSPGLRALREAVREARDLVLKLSARVDTLATASSSEDKSLPPGKKELRELRARMDEERGRILLEVENRLEEAEELMRRSTENRIAALESWIRRVSRYLGIGKKGGLFR